MNEWSFAERGFLVRLILVRHGQSVGNIVKEDMPDPPLTPLGVEQAKLTRDYLLDFEIDHILASPLIRSLATAQPLAQELGLPITVWRELMEVRRLGLYVGPSSLELLKTFPEAEFDPDINEDGWVCEGNETPRKAAMRAKRVLERLSPQYAGQTVAVFAHGDFNHYLLCAALGITQYDMFRFRQSNGCVNIIDCTGEPVTVHVINDDMHQRNVVLAVEQDVV